MHVIHEEFHTCPITKNYKNELHVMSQLRRASAEATPAQREPSSELLGLVVTKSGQQKAVRILFDSGSSNSIVLNDFADEVTQTSTSQWMTKAGTLETSGVSQILMRLPSFDHKKKIKWVFHVDSNSRSEESRYDIIVGRDLMTSIGIIIDYKNQRFVIEDTMVPMRPWNPIFTPADARNEMQQELLRIREVLSTSKNVAGLQNRVTKILDAKYEKADLEQVTSSCNHLSKDEQNALLRLLKKYEILFDGTLGDWKGSEVHFQVKPGTKPYHARAFPIPQIHEQTVRKEVDRLCKLGVLKKQNNSEYAAPTFIIPKKNQTVRFISDFRKLNQMIVRHPFPIPLIKDLLQKLEGFMYASSLDLNMGYYTIRLDAHSQRLCTIILPWGKYSYMRLPMGVANSPDIFQEKMSELMEGLEFVRTYLDDCLVITKGDFQEHLESLEKVLLRLAEAGLKVNAEKSFFGRAELEYLGYWVTREGIAPIPKKVEAMLALSKPKNVRELRHFIGMINYYRDMWRGRSHILAPLNELVSTKTKWKWTERQDQAFDDIKKIIGQTVLLAFPNFNKPFIIHTDASLRQLGAVVSQDDKPIAFYSRKLNPAQTRYTTGERELLSIVETLKEFRNILLGQHIIVYTDHKNLTYENFNTDRVMRWRLIIEEYNCEFKYIKGSKNVIADALSRLDTTNNPDIDSPMPTRETLSESFAISSLPEDIIPLSTRAIAYYQAKDQALQRSMQASPNEYEKRMMRGGEVICRDGKIVVPTNLQKRTVEWYHSTLCHPGATRTEETIKQHLTWTNMRNDVREIIKKCPNCQRQKRVQLKYGHLPPKEAEVQPWEILQVDLIGPYTIRRKRRKDLKLVAALTMTDPATGWFEIAELNSKQADEVANRLEMSWLTRYPWPTKIIYDRGGEFKAEFAELIQQEYDIQPSPITTQNPQSNAMLERIHKTIGDMARSMGLQDHIQDDAWEGILSAIAFAIRATYHTTTQATPGQLVFGRDMIWNVQHIADWRVIQQRKEALINRNNARENSKRRPYQYQIGDRVLMRNADAYKWETQRKGPYQVLRINDNGTLQIQRGAIVDVVNIRQLRPYHE